MLTRKQSELLTYIQAELAKSGVSPSFEEMKEALSLKSKSGVHRLISALEERGFIRRLPPQARHLAVELDPDMAEFLARTHPGLEVIAGDAVKLGTLLAERGVDKADAVVSGLP